MKPLAVCALFLAVGCVCRPQDAAGTRPRTNDDDDDDGGAVTPTMPTTPAGRTSRLQKPTQVLNTAFDEIVVESNLQVHNRAAASKNKSKIVLPSNSTASPTGKSARSLLV